MQTRMRLPLAVAVMLLIGQGSTFGQVPVGSGFTYQGQLKAGGIPADGDVDLADLAALLGVYGTTCP